MAHFEDDNGKAIAELHARPGATVTIALWGGGPDGEALEVVCEPLFHLVEEVTVVNARPHTRFFTIHKDNE